MYWQEKWALHRVDRNLCLYLHWVWEGCIAQRILLQRQQLSWWLLKLSCNRAGESQCIYWLGLAQLSEFKLTAWLSLKKKLGWLRQCGSGWLQLLELPQY